MRSWRRCERDHDSEGRLGCVKSMSWHFLQGEEEASWEGSCLAGAPSALSSSIPTADPSSLPGNETACSLAFQSGTTSAPSTAEPGVAISTSSRAGFHARISVAQGHAPGSLEAARACGRSLRASLARYGLQWSSWRTPRTCGRADSLPSSAILPAWGMTLAGECWGLGTSAPRIGDTECGLLPSPLATDGPARCGGKNARAGKRLTKQAIREWLVLPSPRASDADKGGRGDLLQAWRGNSNSHFSLPTPTAVPYGNNRGGAAGRVGAVRPSLEALLGGPRISFREWMMGWVIGWTALEPLAMDRFREWLHWHGRF
jgi:hypothetical protein